MKAKNAKAPPKGQPIVHFEIIGKDPEKLRSYYGELFGWEFDTNAPVAEAHGIMAARLRRLDEEHVRESGWLRSRWKK